MIKYDEEYYKKQISDDHQIDYLFPKSDSPLMLKRGTEYMRMMDKHEVVFCTMDEAKSCPYDLERPEGINDKHIFTALMNVYVTSGKTTYGDFAKFIGFDMDCLPDAVYMMHLLYRVDSTSPMFSTQSKKGSMTHTEEKAIMFSLLKGKKQVSHMNPKALHVGYKVKLVELAQTYEFSKFKFSDFKDVGKQITAYGTKNEDALKIMNSFLTRTEKTILPKSEDEFLLNVPAIKIDVKKELDKLEALKNKEKNEETRMLFEK